MNRRDFLQWGGLFALGLAGCGGGGDEGSDSGSGGSGDRPFATGWTQMPADVYNALPQVAGHDLPQVGFQSYDLSDPSLLAQAGFPKFLPTPGNQGRQPSCTAWAVGYSLATTALQYSGLSLAAPISPADLFAKVLRRIPTACTSGAFVSFAMDALVDEGVTTLNVIPYSDQQCGFSSPTQVFNLDGYSRVSPADVLALRASISSNQPIAFGMMVPETAFDLNPSNHVLRPNGSGTGHAMSLVGFNDASRLFKVVNSWGAQWGDGGFCFISYDDFALYASDVCLPWKRNAASNSIISSNTSNPSSPVVAQHINARRYGVNGVFGVGVELGWSAPLVIAGATISVTDANNNFLFTQEFRVSQIARGIRFGTLIPVGVTGFVRVWATVTGTDSANRVVSIGALTQPPTR